MRPGPQGGLQQYRSIILLLGPLALVGLPALMAIRLATPVQAPEPRLDTSPQRFHGKRAATLQRELVERSPYRSSGQANNERAVAWISSHLQQNGFDTSIDSWPVINYDAPVVLRNVVAIRRGTSGHEIVLVAHHDQSPETIEGADNDASGIAILLHLAETLASRHLTHDLVFLSSDAEEFGMLGARRYVTTHPNPEQILAAVSLDNLGKRWSTGVEMATTGQFRGVGPL